MDELNLAQEQRQFLERVLARTGWTATELSRRASLDHSTLSRFLQGGREGHALRHSTIRKIEFASGLSFTGSSAVLVKGDAARIEGLGEAEATPLAVDAEINPLVTAVVKGRNSVDPWLLRSRALENLGYRPGDMLLVDLNLKPQPGDVVLAQVFDWQKGGAETVFRSFQPPYLVAQTNDERLLRPMLVDDNAVVIKGVVVLSYRQRHAA